MPLPKLKQLFVSETGIRFCAIVLQISLLALAIASKKTSVKLAQSVLDLAQSVKLRGLTMDRWKSRSFIIETISLPTVPQAPSCFSFKSIKSSTWQEIKLIPLFQLIPSLDHLFIEKILDTVDIGVLRTHLKVQRAPEWRSIAALIQCWQRRRQHRQRQIQRQDLQLLHHLGDQVSFKLISLPFVIDMKSN